MTDLFRPFCAPEAADAVKKVMTPDENGRVFIGQGPQVEAFEKEFAELVGSKEPLLAVNSCTSAITLALHLIGVERYDWVVSTPMTCSATNLPVLHAGAFIEWADIDSVSGLIDVKSVEKAIKSGTQKYHCFPSAIIAVDWAGSPCDYDALRQFGIPVIQDAAHRVYALEPSHGDYVCWSHGPIKHLTCGDGGSMRVPPEQYERAKMLRWYGLDRESKADFRCSQSIREAGWKYQMNDIAASIGRANMKHTKCIVEKHRANAKALGATDNHSDYWFYSMVVGDRARFMQFMQERGIMTSQVHRRNDEHECFARYRRHLPGLDAFSSRNVGLPCGWWLKTEDVEHIKNALDEWQSCI